MNAFRLFGSTHLQTWHSRNRERDREHSYEWIRVLQSWKDETNKCNKKWAKNTRLPESSWWTMHAEAEGNFAVTLSNGLNQSTVNTRHIHLFQQFFFWFLTCHWPSAHVKLLKNFACSFFSLHITKWFVVVCRQTKLWWPSASLEKHHIGHRESVRRRITQYRSIVLIVAAIIVPLGASINFAANWQHSSRAGCSYYICGWFDFPRNVISDSIDWVVMCG